MSKRTERPKIVQSGFDPETGLPTPQQAQQVTQTAVAPTTRKKTFTLQDATAPPPRDPGLTVKGRAKFTTMLKPELRQALEHIAHNKQMSVADVLELMIVEYLDLPGTL